MSSQFQFQFLAYIAAFRMFMVGVHYDTCGFSVYSKRSNFASCTLNKDNSFCADCIIAGKVNIDFLSLP